MKKQTACCANTGPGKCYCKIILANDVDELIGKLINGPRKALNYQTPAKLMTEHMTTIVI